MALYRYVKAQPAYVTVNHSLRPAAPIAIELSVSKIIPIMMMALGLVLVSSVATPILYYELVTSPRIKRTAFLSPLPGTLTELQARTQVAGVSTYQFPPQPAVSPPSLPAKLDYTEASNWFPGAPLTRPNPSKITHYTISIPKLNIKNAVVAIGGSNLKKTIIQYGGTANPGEYGSPVIFGHSILRQFYNPAETNANRYLSIFSTIMTLEKSDEIVVNFDGIEYTYKVVDKYAVSPTQVEVLQQRYDRQTLKLITCVPEGTYNERGVIEAQLIRV